MNRFYAFLERLRRDETAQDMIEYVLLTAFIAVAAGATTPPVADQISVIFSKMTSVAQNASQQ